MLKRSYGKRDGLPREVADQLAVLNVHAAFTHYRLCDQPRYRSSNLLAPLQRRLDRGNGRARCDIECWKNIGRPFVRSLSSSKERSTAYWVSLHAFGVASLPHRPH